MSVPWHLRPDPPLTDLDRERIELAAQYNEASGYTEIMRGRRDPEGEAERLIESLNGES